MYGVGTVLLLLLSVVTCISRQVSAEHMWNYCINMEPVKKFPTGGYYDAIGCNFTDGRVELKDTRDSSRGPLTWFIMGGNVLQGGIVLSGPTVSNVTSLNITVRDMQFQDTFLIFQNTLPANSSLTLTNNAFYLTQRNVPSILTADAIFAIGLNFSSLRNNTLISVTNNRISAHTVLALSAIYLASGTLALTNNSRMCVNGNIVFNTSSIGIVRAVSFGNNQPLILDVIGSSLLSMSNNSMINVSTNGSMAVIYWTTGYSIKLLISDKSVVDVSHNDLSSFATNMPISGMVYAFYLNGDGSYGFSYLITNKSHFTVHNNKISANASDITAIYLYGKADTTFMVSNGSHFSVCSNRVVDSTATDGIYVVHWYPWGGIKISVIAESTLFLSNNSAENSTAGTFRNVCAVQLQFVRLPNNFINISDGSSFRLDSNKVHRCVTLAYTADFEASSAVMLSSLQNGFSVAACNSSLISFSGNEISNSTFRLARVVQIITAVGPLSLTICSNSSLIMSGNSIVHTKTTGTGIPSIVYLSGSAGLGVSVTQNSRLAVSNNTIRNVTSTNIYAIAWLKLMYIQVLNRSSVTFLGNTILNTSCTSFYIVHWNRESQASQLNVSENSLVTFANTSAWNNVAITVFGISLNLRTINLNVSGYFSIHQTLISGSGRVTAILISVISMTISDSSVFLLHNNSIINNNIHTLASLTFASIILQSRSLLSFRGNSIVGVGSGDTQMLSINAASTGALLTTQNSSSVLIEGNMINANSGTVGKVLLISAMMTCTLSENANLVVSNNTINARARDVSFVSFDRQVNLGLRSLLIVANNTFQVEAKTTMPFYFSQIYSSQEGSSVSVVHNYLSLTVNAPSNASWLNMSLIGIANVTIAGNQVTSMYPMSILVPRVGIPSYSSLTISDNSLTIGLRQQNNQQVRFLDVSDLTSVPGSVLTINNNSLSVVFGLHSLDNYVVLLQITKISPNIGIPRIFIRVCRNMLERDGSLENIDGYLVPTDIAQSAEICQIIAVSRSRSRGESWSRKRAEQSLSPFVSSGVSVAHSRSAVGLLTSSQPLTTRSLVLTSAPSKALSPTFSIPMTLSMAEGSYSPFYIETVTLSSTVSAQPSQSMSEPVKIPPQLEIVPVAVPAETMAALTATASAVGGAVTAVDAQTIAVVALVSCAGHNKDTKNMRALSIVALDNTCEGVLVGNAIVVGAAAFGSTLLVFIIRLTLTRNRKLKRMISPTLSSFANACAIVRAPQLFLSLGVYFMNGFAVCGLQIAADGNVWGVVAFIFPMMIVFCFPLLTYLFGARRLLHVRYNWQPRFLNRVGSFVFQSWALDERVPAYKLFGCAMGGYRRLGCLWSLVPHISFLAGLPMILATAGSGICGQLFTLSASLYFVGAVVILVFWPRRVLLSDLFHGITLITNGLVVSNAAVLVFYPAMASDSTSRTALAHLGTLITVLTVVRTAHSVVQIILRLLSQRGLVGGIEVLPFQSFPKDDRRRSGYQCNCAKWLRVTHFECNGKLWPLTQFSAPSTDDPLDGAGSFSDMLLDVAVGVTAAEPAALLTERSMIMEREWMANEGLMLELASQDSQVSQMIPQTTPVNSTTNHHQSKVLTGQLTKYRRWAENLSDERSQDLFLTEDERLRQSVARDCALRDINELVKYK